MSRYYDKHVDLHCNHAEGRILYLDYPMEEVFGVNLGRVKGTGGGRTQGWPLV